MKLQITYSERAINQAAAFLRDDRPGLETLMSAVEHLADDPRPAHSVAFGSPDVRRLRIGRYRVLYEILGTQIEIVRPVRVPADS